MRRTALATALVVAVALAVGARALGNGFVWDDGIIVHRQLAAYRSPLDALVPPDRVPQASPFYYRPVVILTYLADHALGGGAPFPFHLTPVLLHAVACGLLLVLFHRLLGGAALAAATAGALAFAVHPVHTEVFAWMAGRGDALATIGVAAALLAWGRFLGGGGWPWLAAGGGALVLGLLSKEAALVAVPLGAALPWVWPAAGARGRAAALWAALALAVGAWVALRAAAFGLAPGVEQPAAVTPADLLAALGFYARVLVWPTTPGVVMTAVPTDARNLAWGAAAAIGGGGALVVALVRGARLPAWALLWIAAGLVPPLALVVRAISETPVAERYVYLPSAGAALLLAWALARLPERRRLPVLGALGVLLAVGAVATARRTALWHDDLRFWQSAAAATPAEGFPHMKLALVLHAKGDLAGAEAENERALASRLSPQQRAVVQNNLGWVLLRQGRAAEAEPLFRACLAAGPAFEGPYRGLAETLWTLHDRRPDAATAAEMQALLERALHLDPSGARAALLLAHVHLAAGDREAAIRWFRYATQAAPRSRAAADAATALAALGAR